MKTEHFYIGWNDGKENKKGIVFLNHQEFANVFVQHPSWCDKEPSRNIVLNRSTLAIDMGLPAQRGFTSFGEMLEVLEVWLKTNSGK